MNKFFTFFCALAIAGAAFAADREGAFGLGFQETLTSNINGTGGSNNSLGAWSIKYGFSPRSTFQFVAGFDLGKDVDKRFNLGARLLYDLVENENSDFYTGLGVVFDRDKSANGQDAVVRVNIPLGFEFSFAGLPEVGISAEAGIMVDFQMSEPKALQLSSVGGIAGALGLGAHYYF